MGILRVSKVSNMGVSRVFEGSYKGVKGRYTGISRVLHQSYKNVTRVVSLFHWCFNEVIRVLLGRHKGISWVSQGCNMSRVTTQD